jgi:hypothetical protein
VRAPVAAVLAALLMSGCTWFGTINSVSPADYLTSGTYRHWLVEVDSSSGDGPTSSLLNFVHDRIAPLVNKPEGMDFQNDETLEAGSRAWSSSDLQSYAENHLGHHTGSGTVVTHLLFLSGHSDQDDSNGKVLGITFGYDLIVIFSDSVAAACPSVAVPPCLVSPASIMQAVVVHEFGHALGLVNRGTPMVTPHEDGQHAGHSSNSGSVMYWAVESSTVTSVLSGGPPSDFDSNDRADLHHAGGV